MNNTRGENSERNGFRLVAMIMYLTQKGQKRVTHELRN